MCMQDLFSNEYTTWEVGTFSLSLTTDTSIIFKGSCVYLLINPLCILSLII